VLESVKNCVVDNVKTFKNLENHIKINSQSHCF